MNFESIKRVPRRLYEIVFDRQKSTDAKNKKTDGDARPPEPSLCGKLFRDTFSIGFGLLVVGLLVPAFFELYHMRITYVDIKADDESQFKENMDLINTWCQATESLSPVERSARMMSRKCTEASQFVRGYPSTRIFDKWIAIHGNHFRFIGDFCRDGFCRGIFSQVMSLATYGTFGVVLLLFLAGLVVLVIASKTIVQPAKDIRESIKRKNKADDLSIPADLHDADRREKERIELEQQRVMEQERAGKTTTMPPRIGSAYRKTWEAPFSMSSPNA